MTTYRLIWDDQVGRSGPNRPRSPSLWDYIKPAPAWPHSILIQQDETVEQISTPTQVQTKEARRYIQGGVHFLIEDTDPDYALLVAAGYNFEAV